MDRVSYDIGVPLAKKIAGPIQHEREKPSDDAEFRRSLMEDPELAPTQPNNTQSKFVKKNRLTENTPDADAVSGFFAAESVLDGITIAEASTRLRQQDLSADEFLKAVPPSVRRLSNVSGVLNNNNVHPRSEGSTIDREALRSTVASTSQVRSLQVADITTPAQATIDFQSSPRHFEIAPAHHPVLENAPAVQSQLAAQSQEIAPFTAVRNQIVAVVKAPRAGDTLEIMLDPPELGKVLIEFDLDLDGAVRAIVSAENDRTYDLLRRNLDHLRLALASMDFLGVDISMADREGALAAGGKAALGHATEAGAETDDTGPPHQEVVVTISGALNRTIDIRL